MEVKVNFWYFIGSFVVIVLVINWLCMVCKMVFFFLFFILLINKVLWVFKIILVLKFCFIVVSVNFRGW